MYLAKVHIAPARAKNPYEWHRALWQLFPDRPEEERKFLFRVEKREHQTGIHLLMQSSVEPHANGENVSCLARKRIGFTPSEGDVLRFCLRANPVKAEKYANRGTVTRNGTTYVRSARKPLYDEDEQRTWLANKLSRGGAELSAVNIVQEAPLYFHKMKGSRGGKIQPVFFEGVLLVKDPVSFGSMLEQGVGPAKAFGMGLLSLAGA